MLHKDEPTNRRLFSCPWKMRNVRKIESLTLAQWNQVILCSRTWIFCTASISRDFFQLSVLKYGFLKKLFLYQWTSDQLNIFWSKLDSHLWFWNHFQAQMFHLPVPDNCDLEEAIKQLFDPCGKPLENMKCQDCNETVTIRKLMSITDPKVIRGYLV